ncbi:MAG: 2-hydroxyglutaryl-CoA dehydratase [Dehalococcoidia bacterium]|nr:2-hydroxyglutaryl-CoA dehydratase [Dehalococcoidia bacterium]
MLNDISGLYFAGIDIGSTMSKAVITDASGGMRAYVTGSTGAEHRLRANMVMEDVLQKAGTRLDEVAFIISTGYGRVNVPFADKQVTELTCHARGVSALFPDVRTAIDIGGQDAKVLKIKNGRLIDFLTNDKCAAGTGRFLEVAAETLGLDLNEMSRISLQTETPVKINSLCTIFAQQEIISRLSEGQPLPDILAGVYIAVTTRVVKLARQLKVEPPVVFTGGVAKNKGMLKAMETVLGMPVLVPVEPLITGALGAAILAHDEAFRLVQDGRFEMKKRVLREAHIDFVEQDR